PFMLLDSTRRIFVALGFKYNGQLEVYQQVLHIFQVKYVLFWLQRLLPTNNRLSPHFHFTNFSRHLSSLPGDSDLGFSTEKIFESVGLNCPLIIRTSSPGSVSKWSKGPYRLSEEAHRNASVNLEEIFDE